ncbi:MAG: aspartate aminotransferase family protein [Chitinophagaceae bacterium]|nr:aspartate aminotransferase family protein [Chitinophagaceae bacterium]
MKENVYSRSADLLDRARKVLAGGVSSEFRKYSYPHPLFYDYGEGSSIYDVDGNRYLDFTLSQGPLILGHSHPAVLKAVEEYSRKGQIFAGQHIRELELAEKLQSLIPSAELMRFCLDGSEAVQTAFRIARAKTGRQKFLRFEGHYHGWMDNVCWGLSAPSADALGSREDPAVFPWSGGISENSRDDFMVLPWNDADLLSAIMAKRYPEIAAIIMEPVMCNNGCIPPVDGFLERVRSICDQYGIALIFDEVITGFRLSLGGAQQYFQVVPDLSIFAKAMGSGYPISVVAGKKEWMKVVEDSTVIHAGTMNAGHAPVAASLATLATLESENPYPRLFAYGRKLMDGLKQAAQETSQNLRVQGMGPMFNCCFTDLQTITDYRDTLTADKSKLNRFIAAMHNERIRIIGRGLWYISAAHTEQEIDHAIEISKKVLAALG